MPLARRISNRLVVLMVVASTFACSGGGEDSGTSGSFACENAEYGCIRGHLAPAENFSVVFDDSEESFVGEQDFAARFEAVFMPRIKTIVPYDQDDEVTVSPPASASFLEGSYAFVQSDTRYLQVDLNSVTPRIDGLVADTYDFDVVRESQIHFKLITGGSFTTQNICMLLIAHVPDQQINPEVQGQASRDVGTLRRFKFFARDDFTGCDKKAKDVPKAERSL